MFWYKNLYFAQLLRSTEVFRMPDNIFFVSLPRFQQSMEAVAAWSYEMNIFLWESKSPKLLKRTIQLSV